MTVKSMLRDNIDVICQCHQSGALPSIGPTMSRAGQWWTCASAMTSSDMLGEIETAASRLENPVSEDAMKKVWAWKHGEWRVPQPAGL